MPIVCGIKFRGTGKVYYFAPGEVQDLEVNDYVIVETARGKEMGQVTLPPHQVPEAEIVGELKSVLRRAVPADLLDAQHFRRQEADALVVCKEQVTKFSLPMKVINAEYNFDGTRLTFCFSSEQRVDFRELVRELARIFKTRIELRQIGVRDETKIMGGIGKCGRPLCCATWLTEFYPVSIRMAKQQDLPLSPMEISGCCGRLLCCLGYENDCYQEVKGRFPKVGKMVSTPKGVGKVIKVSVLKEVVIILLEDGSTVNLTAEELAGTAPVQVEVQDLDEEDERASEALATVPMPESTGADESLAEEAAMFVGDGSEEHTSPTREGAGGSSSRRWHRPKPAARPVSKPNEPSLQEGEQRDRADSAGSDSASTRPARRRTHHPRGSAQPSQSQGQKPERQDQGDDGDEEKKEARNPDSPQSRHSTRSRRHRSRSKTGKTEGTEAKPSGD